MAKQGRPKGLKNKTRRKPSQSTKRGNFATRDEVAGAMLNTIADSITQTRKEVKRHKSKYIHIPKVVLLYVLSYGIGIYMVVSLFAMSAAIPEAANRWSWWTIGSAMAILVFTIFVVNHGIFINMALDKRS